jgi:hypothetical protein
MTPVKGQALYRANWETDQIEHFIFLKEDIAEGASVPTWVIRNPRTEQRTRISRNNGYRFTKKEAIKDALQNLRHSVKCGRKAIAETRTQIQDAQKRIKVILATTKTE